MTPDPYTVTSTPPTIPALTPPTTIASTTTTVAAPPSGSLPVTGGDWLTLAALGWLIVVVGVLAWAGARR